MGRLAATSLLAVTLLAAFGGTSAAQEWGSLKGKFVFKGDGTTDEELQINKDVEYCSQFNPVDETIVLGEGEALKNVFVYLYVGRRDTVDVHPDIKPSEEPVVLTNEGCRFSPHALVVWTDNTLEVRNDDEGIGHNTNIQMAVNTDFNQTISNENPLNPPLERSEPMPAPVVCNIHPWMKAHILVRDNPYMAVSGDDGTFVIENIPAGEREFTFWHEAKGYLRDLEVNGEEADRRGQVEIEIKPGETVDLGEIVVTPAILGL